MNHKLNWRLPGFGLFLGLFLAALLYSLGPGIAAGASAFFQLTLSVVGIAIFVLATPTDQLSSKLRAFSERILIGVVWILIAWIALVVMSLH